MAVIRTVLGSISPSELGVTYGHEHLITCPPEFVLKLDSDLELNNVDKAIQELGYFAMAGGRSLVECTTIDYGRNIELINTIAHKSPVHIILVTGFQKSKYLAPYVDGKSINEIADWMVKELLEGIENTSIKPNLIKVGSSLNMITEDEKKVMIAASRAHLETGSPITTHTEAGTMGFEQLEILVKEGVDPSRIMIGHLDRNLDWDYHKQLAARGCFLIFDHLSKEKYAPDKVRVEFILRLVKEGYGKQILFSGDFGRKSYWPSYGGGPGFTFILWRFIPWLRFAGLCEQAIEDILINNPRQALQK